MIFSSPSIEPFRKKLSIICLITRRIDRRGRLGKHFSAGLHPQGRYHMNRARGAEIQGPTACKFRYRRDAQCFPAQNTGSVSRRKLLGTQPARRRASLSSYTLLTNAPPAGPCWIPMLVGTTTRISTVLFCTNCARYYFCELGCTFVQTISTKRLLQCLQRAFETAQR